MSALNKQITVSKEAYKRRWNSGMSQSLQDAFNDILSNFSEANPDTKYADEMHQFLKNDKGDVYYFDNFKYVFPRQIGDASYACALYNTGNNFNYVEYICGNIFLKEYNGSDTAKITEYFLTPEAREYVEKTDDMGYFLLEVAGKSASCIEKLRLGSIITVKREKGNLVSYDVNGNLIDTVPSNVDEFSSPMPSVSFYKEIKNKVNYRKLLIDTYKSEFTENQGPVR